MAGFGMDPCVFGGFGGFALKVYKICLSTSQNKIQKSTKNLKEVLSVIKQGIK